jgi:hypothetical protein
MCWTSDTLSVQCVNEIRAWDGGKYFPYDGTADIDPTSVLGREWAARLQPIMRTAAFEYLWPPAITLNVRPSKEGPHQIEPGMGVPKAVA